MRSFIQFYKFIGLKVVNESKKYKNVALIKLFVFSVFSILNAQYTDWQPLFEDGLSNANYPEGVWSIKDGVITATEDQCVWTKTDYSNFILDLEFKTADGIYK